MDAGVLPERNRVMAYSEPSLPILNTLWHIAIVEHEINVQYFWLPSNRKKILRSSDAARCEIKPTIGHNSSLCPVVPN
jgi:hypothetical protein